MPNRHPFEIGSAMQANSYDVIIVGRIEIIFIWGCSDSASSVKS